MSKSFKFSNVKYSDKWEEFNVSDEVKQAKEIIIPKGTLEIENYACFGCESVENIHIPHTVSKIGIGAFANCKELKEINIPYQIEILENDTFYNCVNLETLTISPNLKKVSETALLNCQKLKTIYIACDNFKDFDEYVKKIKNDKILSNVSFKWKYLYASKIFFTSFNFTTIPNYDKCSYLVIPRGTKTLESCKGAKNLEIIEGLKDVELCENVFENCNKIKEIEIFQDIPKYAFKNCKGLEHIIIHGCVDESAFEECSKLIKVEFIKIKDENKVMKQYRNFLFMHLQKEILKNAYGGAQPNISSSKIEDMDCLLPTLPEQKQIVTEIEQRFEQADVLERSITNALDNAEKLKQSILKKAFEGKLVPQDPKDEPASVLLDHIQSEQKKGKKK